MNLKDQWWDIFELNEYTLHLFEKAYSQDIFKWIPWSSPIEDREYVSVYLRADQMHNFYKREEYDLLTFFGDLGGLQGVIFGLGWFFSVAMVTRLVKAAMVEKTYRWQKYDIDDTQYYETKIAGQVSPENSSDDNDEQKAMQEELKAA